MNGEAKDAKNFVHFVKSIIDQETSKRSTDAVCQIQNVNPDGTLNIYVLPDMNNIIHNVRNESKNKFVSGDYALLYIVKNNLTNSFVFAKYGAVSNDESATSVSYVENVSVYSGDSNGKMYPHKLSLHFYKHNLNSADTDMGTGEVRYMCDSSKPLTTAEEILGYTNSIRCGNVMTDVMSIWISTGVIPKCTLYTFEPMYEDGTAAGIHARCRFHYQTVDGGMVNEQSVQYQREDGTYGYYSRYIYPYIVTSKTGMDKEYVYVVVSDEVFDH